MVVLPSSNDVHQNQVIHQEGIRALSTSILGYELVWNN